MLLYALHTELAKLASPYLKLLQEITTIVFIQLCNNKCLSLFITVYIYICMYVYVRIVTSVV